MPEKPPLRGPSLLVASLLFLVGVIALVGGLLYTLGGDSMGGALDLIAAATAFGLLLSVLSKNSGS
jgi:hypothetical protein